MYGLFFDNTTTLFLFLMLLLMRLLLQVSDGLDLLALFIAGSLNRWLASAVPQLTKKPNKFDRSRIDRLCLEWEVSVKTVLSNGQTVFFSREASWKYHVEAVSNQ